MRPPAREPQICTPGSPAMAGGAGQRACKITISDQNLPLPTYCCAEPSFQNHLQTRHKAQLSRSRFFYRKATISCLSARFNTEKSKNENVSMKNRIQVQRKVKSVATGGKWCTNPSTQKPFFTAKLPEVRRQTSSPAVFLSLSFLGIQFSSPGKEHCLSFPFAGTSQPPKTPEGSLN